MLLENFRLKIFRSVANHLSFRKAGEALYLTQPAVSLQIKTLETELGTKLFERSPAGVRLSEAGKVLLPYAEQMHQLALDAEARLAGLRGDSAGELVLGASTTIAQYVLPDLLADFSRTYPAVSLQLCSLNTERVSDGVASGRFALGLIEGPAQRRDLRARPWFNHEILLVVPANHEWAAMKVVAPGAIAGAPLVMRERGSGTRQIVESGLLKAGLRPELLHIVRELESTEAILSCVEDGVGVGFISEWALIRPHLLAPVRVRGLKFRHPFALISAPGLEPRGAAATLEQFLRDRIPAIPGQCRDITPRAVSGMSQSAA